MPILDASLQMGIRNLKEIDLHYKTRITELILPGAKAAGIGVSLWRDELIHPQIQGNKWRKLKYYLIKYQKENKNHLVSCGGVWSNHLHALGAAAWKFGFRLSVFVRGNQGVSTDMLEDLKRWNTEVIFCKREEYRLAEQADEIFIASMIGKNHFGFIPSGGFGVPALEGLREMAAEIGEEWPLVAVAAGSGITSLGLSAYLAPHQCILAYSAFPESSKARPEESASFIHPKAEIRRYASEVVSGFARPKPEVMSFAHELFQSSGVLCDPIYTGPMLLQLSKQIQEGHFQEGSKILAIHSGGLQGWRGFASEIPSSLRFALEPSKEEDFSFQGQ